MKAQRSGVIVNISSQTGISLLDGGNLAVYGAAKAAVIQLTQTLALEHAPDAIRVNGVAPSFIETPASAALVSPEPPPQPAEAISEAKPTRRSERRTFGIEVMLGARLSPGNPVYQIFQHRVGQVSHPVELLHINIGANVTRRMNAVKLP